MNVTITSRNITPDVQSYLPADLTFDQFVEVMRTGKDFDNLHPRIEPKTAGNGVAIFLQYD